MKHAYMKAGSIGPSTKTRKIRIEIQDAINELEEGLNIFKTDFTDKLK